MQKYMFLFRGGDAARAAASPEEMQQHLRKWGTWFRGLGDKFKGGEPLDMTGKVLRGTGKALSDGPFAETKDLVGGYAIVEASSLEDAVEIARGCPIFEHDGILEVRPIREMKM
ncbi:MAG: YciI family protein [Deltaproteobacteria bacterium]|nr:YciI family protein [Deltaproteobacteria bacterium]